jgi:glycosyltransferase involved in cell wall biosynthesis
VNVAFVLASYRRDAPAGMERSVAALCAGFRELGHGAVVLSAEPAAAGDAGVVSLRSLGVAFPCDDATLRAAVSGNRQLVAEVESIVAAHGIDVVSYVDALWGLGIMEPVARVRRILMVHVVGHVEDIRPALGQRPDAVIAPSRTVLAEAARAGYDTDRWRVVPNALMVADPVLPDHAARDRLRVEGPVRVMARLGPEKGVLDLLQATPPRWRRRTQVAVASAGFEAGPGSQDDLMDRCRACASHLGWLEVRPGLLWCDVPAFMAGAAVVVVPSHRETFGLVALEAMSAGTPVVARAVGNLPDLVGPAGALVPADAGDATLWEAVRGLTADADVYMKASRAGPERSRAYRPADVARRWLEAATR